MTWDHLPDSAQLAWSLLSTLVVVAAAVLTIGHVVLYKRETRSALGWVIVILLVPLGGAVLYLLLGINRIKRRAAALRAQQESLSALIDGHDASEALDPSYPQLRSLAALMHRVTGEPLMGGHTLEPLDNGDEAYPRMLEAIEQAQHCVCMSTYIFEPRGPGALFVEALVRAQQRGVQVRVLIDAVGARYAKPRPDRVFRERGIPVGVFMPARALGYSRYYNLRNHRKILVVDGVRAFTGGMNVRVGQVLSQPSAHPVRDLHFEVRGPMCRWLTGVFAEDWEFATREQLEGVPWFVDSPAQGEVLSRGVVDGPDADMDKFRWALMGGLACAQHSVRVVTPYFLPDSPLMSTLNLAALRGVRVDVVLPERGNLRTVHWAMRAHLEREMSTPVRYWLSPAPFDHTKLLVVDDLWSLIGSANWDPRSLRLNFEVGIESYDESLARDLARRVDQRIAAARRLTAAELAERSLPARFRDGLARLLTPYL